MDTEQWKSGGLCGICRRNNYCKKACTATNKRRQALLASKLLSGTPAQFHDAVKERLND